MKELPLHERPRERLLKYGSDYLSNVELLAIVLGKGVKDQPVLRLASNLLERFQTLGSLFSASVSDLMEVRGIGRVKAIELKAIFTLTKRTAGYFHETDLFCTSTMQAAFFLQDLFLGQTKEIAVLLLLDCRQKVITRNVLSIGCLTEVLIHPRELFHEILREKAHSFFIAHNHPSGDPAPSSHDCRLTDIIYQGAELLGIFCRDHLIFGGKKVYSMRKACSMFIPNID